MVIDELFSQDKPVGAGGGHFRGRRVFKSQQDHAMFIPVTSLVRAHDFEHEKQDLLQLNDRYFFHRFHRRRDFNVH